MLKINHLSFSYGKKKILDNIDLAVEPCEIVGLVAPNGTGKTTLLKIIANTLPYKSGNISYKEFSHEEISYKKQLFFLENVETLFNDLTVYDHLALVKKVWKSNVEVEEIMEKFSLQKIRNTPIKKLSLGLKQSVLLTLYVISDADVLLFDEPINGLDPTNILVLNKMLLYLQKKKKIMLYSSHNLENLNKVATKILFLHEKNLVEIDKQSNLQEEYQKHFVSWDSVKDWD
ncbi:ABC-2 type transport system ATP-binding protein [Pilibacter termitis]|uniref:ABC-2 type transport system ATP-binding protein n=1 Tax=Pilibacter termitis TaxID=263852 RepID=A0A1T4P2E3_9ENTE|nr:ABC transporter ATP-binding protein [Pilibacter termitis]SJZ85694.1 ABC-2 type transport system ATP-binding protein [Pilibacter termitis]